MRLPYDMSSEAARPNSDGWQKIAALGIFATMATIVTGITGSSADVVTIAPYLLMALNVGGRRR